MTASLRPERRLAGSLALLFVMLLLLVSRAGAYEDYRSWLPIAPDCRQVSEVERETSSHAVILASLYIIDDRESRFQRSYLSHYSRVLVLDSQGVRDLATVEIPFPDRASFRKISARTVKPDKRTVRLEKSDFHEKLVVSIGRQERRAISFAFKDVEPGDILEYHYTLEKPIWWMPVIKLQGDHATRDFELQWYVWNPRDLSARAILYIGDEMPYVGWVLTNASTLEGEIERQADDDLITGLHLRYQQIPPLLREPHMPPESQVAARFYGYYSQPGLDKRTAYWERIARRWGEQTREFIEKDRFLRDWLEPWMDSPRDLETDIARCFSYVRQRTRNYALTDEEELLGKPPKNDGVDALVKRGVGTSQDICRLVVAMLRQLGHEATLFRACDASEDVFIEEWQMPWQFDMTGVAVRTGGEIRWLYPAIPAADPTMLPWQILGCQVLLEDLGVQACADTFPTFATIPLPPAGANRVNLRARLWPSATGPMVGSLELTWSHPNEPRFIQDILSAAGAEREDLVRRSLLGNDLEPLCRRGAVELTGATVAYRCSLAVEPLVESAGAVLIVTPGRLRGDDYHIPPGDRVAQIWLRHPCTFTSSVEIVIPPGYSPAPAGPPNLLANELANYSSSFEHGNGVVHWRRALELRASLFAPAAAPVLREFFETIYQLDAVPLVLTPHTGD